MEEIPFVSLYITKLICRTPLDCVGGLRKANIGGYSVGPRGTTRLSKRSDPFVQEERPVGPRPTNSSSYSKYRKSKIFLGDTKSNVRLKSLHPDIFF